MSNLFTIRLPRGGRESFTLGFSKLPEGATVEVLIEGDDTWHPLAGSTGQTRDIFLAGPDVSANGAIVVATGGRWIWRVVEDPQLIIRSGGAIVLTELP